MIEELTYLINHAYDRSQNNCHSNSESMMLGIGSPLYHNSDIINNEFGANICCLGSQSCAYSDALWSNLGNILCLGYQS